MIRILVALLLSLLLSASRAADVPIYDFIVKQTFPHNAKSSTQGLFFKDGLLYESTGGNGSSFVRKLELSTGLVLGEIPLPATYFGEGVTAIGDEIVCLTWTSQVGLVLDIDSLKWKRSFSYTGEGWGATSDGDYLYISDGTSRLRVLDKMTFALVREIEVKTDKGPLSGINELEMVGKEIFANIWKSDLIARIDVIGGNVVGWIDLTGILSVGLRANTDVLNGIAYDQKNDRLFVTGKLWPKLFEIALVKRQESRNGAAFKPPSSDQSLIDSRVIGTSAFRMSTYFSDVGDVSTLSLINLAQIDYARRYVVGNFPQHAHLPIVSISAPLKNGTGGAHDFTDVQPGPLRRKEIAELYRFPNTFHIVRISGAELKTWLEKGAERFNTINPNITDPQELINNSVPGFNFDAAAAEELSYEIDVAQRPGHRIQQLQYRNNLVSDDQYFLVATNNFRVSGGGTYPPIAREKVLLAANATIQEILAEYIGKQDLLTRARHGTLRSWRFAKMSLLGPVVFHSPTNLLAIAYENGMNNIRKLKSSDGEEKAVYAIDLAK